MTPGIDYRLEGQLVLEVLAALMITEIRGDCEAISKKLDNLQSIIEQISEVKNEKP